MSENETDDDEVTYSAVRSVFGSSRRNARWHLTDELDILTACGRATFDLREVETTGGEVVEVTATCVLGSISFIVPRGTVVVLDGTSFLASARSDVSSIGNPNLPRIEITATTVLGAVRVYSTDDGEEALTALEVPTTAEIAAPRDLSATNDAEAPVPDAPAEADEPADADEAVNGEADAA